MSVCTLHGPPLAGLALAGSLGVLAAYAGFVTWVSLSPAETFAGVPAVFLRYSKAAHFLLYGVMVSLARWAMAAHWAVRPAFLVVVVGPAPMAA